MAKAIRIRTSHTISLFIFSSSFFILLIEMAGKRLSKLSNFPNSLNFPIYALLLYLHQSVFDGIDHKVGGVAAAGFFEDVCSMFIYRAF